MFHIKITDLKTGEVEVDRDTDCILGAYNLPDDGETVCIQYTACTLATIVGVADGLNKIKNHAAGYVIGKVLGAAGGEPDA